jgi:hypothetical protein
MKKLSWDDRSDAQLWAEILGTVAVVLILWAALVIIA